MKEYYGFIYINIFGDKIENLFRSFSEAQKAWKEIKSQESHKLGACIQSVSEINSIVFTSPEEIQAAENLIEETEQESIRG